MCNLSSERRLLLFFAAFCLSCVFFMLTASAAQAAEVVTYPDADLQTISGSNDSLGPSGSSTGKSDSLDGNTVTLDEGTVGGRVVGAINLNTADAVTNNAVIIKSGGVVGGDIHGGWSNSGAVTGNSVTVESGGQANGNIHGGRSGAEVSGNSVTIEAGVTVRQQVFGGYGDGSGVVQNNEVTSGGATLTVYGGYGNGSVINNTVIIAGGSTDEVSGGTSLGGPVSGNSVTITDAEITQASSSVGFVCGGSTTGTGDVNNNSVTIEGNSQITYSVRGGYSAGGNANGNRVTINGGSVEWFVAGGHSSKGDANDNSVTLGGGSVEQFVAGGHSEGGHANNNSVTLNGGSVKGDVVGGYSGGGDATGNSVTLNGPIAFGENSVLYGGYSKSGGDAFSGNTLHLHSAGLQVAGLYNFEYLNFYVPADLAAGGVMLTATKADISGSTVNVGIAGGSTPLRPGDSIVLIDSSGGELTGEPVNNQASGVGMQGITMLYTFDLTVRDNQLLASIASSEVNPRIKSLSEGRAAGLAFLNQGGDLLIGPGLDHILAATRGAGPGGLTPFAALQGGWSRYDTGSHVDVAGASFLAGLAWRQPLDERGSDLLGGLFFEAGRGGYDSHNSFSGYASVKADGDIGYYGGGVLARYGHADGLYLDASLRTGRVTADFSSSDLRDSTGRKATYDSSSAYYGAHAGLGYIWDVTDQASIDFSTRYIWTRQESDSVRVTGDPVKLKSADSQRWRNGARFAYAVTEQVSPYAGAYFEYEFDGRARASTNGYAIEAPSLRGGTGIAEIGLSLKPLPEERFSLDLGVQGYVGTRQGVTGSAQIKYEF